jgi:hypothetical protein
MAANVDERDVHNGYFVISEEWLLAVKLNSTILKYVQKIYKEIKMTILVTVQAQLIVGEEQVIESISPDGLLAAIFEDDGRTGYLYALDDSVGGNPIQDALHIYDVEDVSDGHIPSDVKIGWSEDSKKCVLLINGYPHGVFNFDTKKGYCRSGFPPPINHKWSVTGHEWDNAVDDFFR